MGHTLNQAIVRVGGDRDTLASTLSVQAGVCSDHSPPTGWWISVHVAPSTLKGSAIPLSPHWVQGQFCSWLGDFDETCPVCLDLLVPPQGLATWAGF